MCLIVFLVQTAHGVPNLNIVKISGALLKLSFYVPIDMRVFEIHVYWLTTNIHKNLASEHYKYAKQKSQRSKAVYTKREVVH